MAKAKFTTTIEKELLEQIKIRAIEEGRNVNEIIEYLLAKYLGVERKKYLKYYFNGSDTYYDVFDNLEEANRSAIQSWAALNRWDRKTYEIFVFSISEDEYEMVRKDETGDLYYEENADQDETMFDSKNTNGFGDDQEIAYVIYNGWEKLENDEIYTLEEAKEEIKRLHEKDGKFYAVVEVGKKDAELVLRGLTLKEMWEFAGDLQGVFNTEDLK